MPKGCGAGACGSAGGCTPRPGVHLAERPRGATRAQPAPRPAAGRGGQARAARFQAGRPSNPAVKPCSQALHLLAEAQHVLQHAAHHEAWREVGRCAELQNVGALAVPAAAARDRRRRRRRQHAPSAVAGPSGGAQKEPGGGLGNAFQACPVRGTRRRARAHTSLPPARPRSPRAVGGHAGFVQVVRADHPILSLLGKQTQHGAQRDAACRGDTEKMRVRCVKSGRGACAARRPGGPARVAGGRGRRERRRVRGGRC